MKNEPAKIVDTMVRRWDNNAWLPVNEMYWTVQGEGSYTGTPAFFIRLQGCPVGCPWCDTKYSWDLTGFNARLEKDNADKNTFSFQPIEKIVEKYRENPVELVVLTGGEPLMHYVDDLIVALIDAGATVQIETSGVYRIPLMDIRRGWLFVTVSPKINMPGGMKVLESALLAADEIKLPVGKARDLLQFLELLDEYDIDPSTLTVWLQPLSQSPKATKLCVETALQNNWQLSVQVHKYIGLD